MKKLISDTTFQKIDFLMPFISKAATFTNHFQNIASVEGAGTVLFIIQKVHCATTKEIITEFKQWSEDKANHFSEDAIISAINSLEQAGFIQETLCGFKITNG